MIALAPSAAAGALVALALTKGSVAAVGMGLCGGLVAWVFVRWPWAVLPVSILGGAVISGALGADRVETVVAVHAAALGIGVAALTLRCAVDRSWGRRVPTPADRAMLALAAGVLLGTAYGLSRGNPPRAVLVAAYEIAVIPAYFFLATFTLTSPRRFHAAGVLYLSGAAAFALVGMAVPGQHGGLFSALALAPVVAVAAAARGSRRALLLALAGVFALDVLLSAYRAMWLATAVALAVLVVHRAVGLRRAAVTSLAAAAVIGITAVVLSGGVRARTELVGVGLERTGGYRIPEARVGMEAFLEEPIAGRGLGQVERQVFLPGFRVTDVGPVYHVFYVMLLANGGLIGLALLVWPLAIALRRRRIETLPYRSLLIGFAVAAAFAGPVDGHWELGLVPALVLVSDRFARSFAQAQRVGRDA